MQTIVEAHESMDPRKKILIVDDHPVFRQGLAQVVDSEEDFFVCGQAGTAAAAMDAIRELDPDLVLVDITLPGKNGLELLKEVRNTNSKAKVLVISMHDEALYASRVLQAGGDGYIMKQEDPGEIVDAMRDILAGHLYVSEEVLASGQGKRGKSKASSTRAAKRPLNELADIELEILELTGLGKTNEQIASEIDLSPTEVSSHLAKIRKKLRLESPKELLRYAVCWVETGAT
jgi:DNA-binding NarL/FixJ family response regulator